MIIRRRVSKASVGLVVVGLHSFGLLIWLTAENRMRLTASDARLASISVWLPALSGLDTGQEKPPSQQRRQTMQGSSVLRKQLQSSPGTPSISLNAKMAPAPIGTPSPSEVRQSVESSTEAPVLPALNLNLSRETIKSMAPPSFAERSPFHGRLPATLERQFAIASDAGPWAEERIDDDRIRFRRGNTCVLLQRPRAAIIDPFSEASARIPWRASMDTCQ